MAMDYLLFEKKTKTTDCKFVGVFRAVNYADAKRSCIRYSRDKGIQHTFEIATLRNVQWGKNDYASRMDGQNTIPESFDLSTHQRIEI